jgi:uroporphyrinogen decarboxylase
MYRDEGAWRALMERFARAIAKYLNAQIAAGAQCVQIFDSWAGCLGPDDYRRYVLPFMQQIVAGITPGVPVINFATGNPALLPLLAAAGRSVVGVDWRVRLDEAWQTVGFERAVQGNLDPCVLLAEREEIRRRAKDVLDQAAGRPGHIFNLGHGVHQQTPVENAIALVDAVHELSRLSPESSSRSLSRSLSRSSSIAALIPMRFDKDRDEDRDKDPFDEDRDKDRDKDCTAWTAEQ